MKKFLLTCTLAICSLLAANAAQAIDFDFKVEIHPGGNIGGSAGVRIPLATAKIAGDLLQEVAYREQDGRGCTERGGRPGLALPALTADDTVPACPCCRGSRYDGPSGDHLSIVDRNGRGCTDGRGRPGLAMVKSVPSEFDLYPTRKPFPPRPLILEKVVDVKFATCPDPRYFPCWPNRPGTVELFPCHRPGPVELS